MNEWFDDLYDILFQPRTALARIAAAPRLTRALVVFAGSTLLVTAVFLMGENIPVWLKGLLILVDLIVSVLTWLATAAVLHLIAELLGGTGGVRQFAAALAFAAVVRVFFVPLYAAASFLPAGAFAPALGVGGLLIGGWALALCVQSVRAVYRFSGLKAVAAAVVIPGGIAALTLLLTVLVIAAAGVYIKLPPAPVQW